MNKERDYIIISDGSCDLPDEVCKEFGIKVVPFYVSVDGIDYKKEKVELDVTEFYKKIAKDSTLTPKTAQPSIADYEKVFEEAVLNDKDVICICITTKFSGSYNSAVVASKMIKEKYPLSKIYVIDSCVNTGLQGLFTIEVAKMHRDGLSFEETIEIAEKLKKTGRIYFTVGNLDYLRKGGRIGKVKGIVGATLKIKPIIVLKDGEIYSGGLAFTRKKSFIKATSLGIEYLKSINESFDDYNFITGYGVDKEEGELYNQKLKTILNRDDIMSIQIGATIGVHTGPYPLGVGFVKKYQTLKK